jgi:chemotaxis protein CheD
VGQQNAEFATKFLKDEGITLVGSSTGGDAGRKLEFWPVSGRARQFALTGAETQRTVQLETRPVVAPKPVESSIEFF